MQSESSSYMVSRRGVLKGAILGAAGVAGMKLMPKHVANYLVDYGLPLNSNDPYLYRTFDGVLAAIGSGVITIIVAGATHKVPISRAASFWKGGTVSVSALTPGDDLLVRLNSSFELDRGWANLARVTGVVGTVQSDGFTIEPQSGVRATVDVTLARAIQMVNMYSVEGSNLALQPAPGFYADVIGLRTGTGLVGTLITLGDPADAQIAQTQMADAAASTQTPSNDPSYKGIASWEYCTTHAGACGTCTGGKNNQVSWPNLGGGCNFSAGCATQGQLSCGSTVTFTPCGGSAAAMTVVDCGPCQNCGLGLCGRGCAAGTCGYATVLLTLTRPTFARYATPANQGCIQCVASY